MSKIFNSYLIIHINNTMFVLNIDLVIILINSNNTCFTFISYSLRSWILISLELTNIYNNYVKIEYINNIN